jgi:hypothetical protein
VFDVLLPPEVDLVVLNGAPLELAGRSALDISCCSTTIRRRGCAGWRQCARSTPMSSRGCSAAAATSSRACFVVDEIRVLRLLQSVTDDLAVLREEATADDRRCADALWLRGVKYTFVTAIEGCVDVAQHICASEGWGPARDNAGAMRVLGAHGVLPAIRPSGWPAPLAPGRRRLSSGVPGRDLPE